MIRLRMVSALAAVVLATACGSDSSVREDTRAEIPASEHKSPPDEAAFLQEARPWASSVEPGENGLDATLLAIG